MKCSLILLLALSFVPITPVWADADLPQRIESLSRRIDKKPDDQVLHLRRAMLYMDANQPDQALADIQVAESLGDPLNAAPTHGILLYRQGDYAAARPYFDRYLQANPAQWDVIKSRARLLRDMGENTLALADYESLIRLSDSLDPGYYVVTAHLMASVPERGVDDALALLDARMAQRGQISTLQRCAVELEAQRGDYKAAIERMTKLDEKLRATPQWQLDVAELLLRADRAQESLPYLAVAQEQLQAGRMTAIRHQLLEKAHRLQLQALNTSRQADKLAVQAPLS